MKRIHRSTGAIALGWLIGSCGGGDGIVGPPPPPPVASVTISADVGTVVPAATLQLTATPKSAAGVALARTLTWTSSDEAKVTVSSSGLVAGVAPGVATVTAAVEGKSASSTITVLDGGVVTSAGATLSLRSGDVQIVVPADALSSPANLSVVPAVSQANDPRVIKDTPFDFGPTGTTFAKPVNLKIKYAAGNLPAGTEEAALQLHLSTPTGWQPVVGSVVDLSAHTVAADVSHFSVYAILAPLPVAAVMIRSPPDKPQIVEGVLTLVAGDSEQLTATPTDAQGGTLSNRAITWATSAPGIASVTTAGLVAAVSPGTANISASAGGVTASITVTVTPVPVAAVAVTLSSQSVQVGKTSQATAAITDAAGHALTGRSVAWSSSDQGVATVTAAGLITAVSPGTATITATSEGKTGTGSITVTAVPVASVNVTLTPNSITAVGTSQATATILDANGNTLSGRTVTWASSNTAVATVDAQGVVTGVAVGTSSITATSEGKSGSATITVTPAPVATVSVTPPTVTVVRLGTQQLTATLEDAHHNVLTGRTIDWSTNAPGVATVSATGLVTAVSAGSATITATSEGKTGTSSITVTLAPVATVNVGLAPTSITAVGTSQATATTLDANGNTLTGRVITWSSTNTAVATVDAQGVVTGIAAGTSSITATSEGKSGSATITVTPAPVASVTVSTPVTPMIVGGTQQVTATTKDSKDRVLTGRVITWVSSNTAVLTVSAGGSPATVTAVGVGTATITATSESVTSSPTPVITVDPVPVATVTVTPGTATLVLSITPTQQLTAVTKDANGNVLTGRVVTWNSSNTGAATVSTSGLVTAVAAGTTTITATSEGKTGTSSITVTVAPVETVNVGLAPTSITAVGTSQATATTLDANGNTLTGRAITWSSSNTAVATVDAQGIVTGVAVGTASITATSEGKSGSATITVTPAPVASVSVSAPVTPMIVGGTQQLTATTKDSKDRVLTGRTITWVSSNTAVLTVSGSGSLATVTGVGLGTATITATSESVTSSPTPVITVNPVPVATVTVTPGTAALVLGITPTQQLTAVTKDANGNVLTGRTVTWASNNATAATVSATGLVTAVGAGSATITATSETQTGTSSITVTLAPVETVNVGLAPTSITAVGTSQATATTLDANGNTVIGRAITWSSGNTAVATVDTEGAVTAVGVGTASITATSEGKSGSATITVTPAPVATVVVSPSTATLVLGITPTQQLIAATKDARGDILTGRTVTWVSNNTGAATVDANGLVTAVGAGSATITATSETQTGTSSITVTLAPVAAVIVSPATTSLVLGITPPQQLTAVTKDANGNVLTDRTVTWGSSNTGVATVSATGLVTAVSAGSATITATSEGKNGTSSITVTLAPVETVNVGLVPTSITAVGTSQATAATLDANGNTVTGRAITWSSSNTAVATVDAEGVVTGVAVGTSSITATSEGKSGSATITVTPAPVVTVVVSPSTATLVLGITPTQQLTAVTKDSRGDVLSGRTVTWSSSNTGAATVSTSGLVTAVAAGSTTITATSEGKNGTSAITVTVAPVETVNVGLAPTSITAVGTSQATATTLDANGNTVTGRAITWTSGNTAVATVDAQGVVTGVAAGTSSITATSEGKSGSATITVTPAPVASVTVSAPVTPMTVGGTQQLTATTKDSKDRVLIGRTITWVSSNTAVLTVSASGSPATVTAVGLGTATITATSESVTSSPTPVITVNPVPVATVTVTPEAATLVLGITPTQQLTAVTKDANGNVLTGRVVTWSSSNTVAATVSTSGLVTAIAAGTTTITATSETQTGTSSITVTVAPVATVNVGLAPTSITAVGTSQATATTLDANGNTLTGRAITWSSGNTAVATVDAEGVVTAVGVGTASITATSEGKSGSATLTVTPAPVATVTVSTPVTPMTVGGTQQLTATTKDSKDRVLTGRVITWVSSNTAVLTVSASGSPATVTAVGLGTATITATSESISSSPTPSITVDPIPVATVTVSPSAATLVLGITPTQQLTAVTKDANDNVLTGRVVTWSSSNTGAATVSTSGLVTAVAAGTTTITATSEGQTGTSAITVTVAPVATVTVSAPVTPMTVGGTQQLTVTTKDANGAVLTGRTITWASSNTAVLTVSGSGSPATVTAVGVGTATITATSESVTSSPTPVITVDPVPVATVTVSPSAATLVLGITPTQQLIAVTKDGNGDVLTGRTVTWSSSNTGAATVSTSGLVTAVAAGTTTITATSEGKDGTSAITVTVAPVATVTLSTSTTPMIVGETQQLTATTKDANGNSLTGRAVTWVSSNTAVLTVSASGSPATVTAVGLGTATITATSESVTSSPTPVITVDPVPVATVTVTPGTATLVLGITPTQQLTAVTKDANGNVLTGRVVTWSSSNTGAATVSATGLVTAVGAGSATITATSEGQTGTSAITVTVAPVETVNVGLAPTSITAVGTSQATATTLDANGNTLTGRAITWSSGNIAVATVDGEGVVTAVAVGTASITATSEGKSGSATITVTPAPVATVVVSPSTASLVLGITPTQQLIAVTKDARGDVLTGRTVTWVSNNTAAATVDANGLVTAVSAGPATITATSEGKNGTSSITVTLAPVETVNVGLAPTSITAVGTSQATATTLDANGNTLSGRTITWSSGNTVVATVDAEGAVTAIAVGTANIVATSEGKTGSAPLTVTPAPVASVALSAPATPMTVGGTQQLTATTKDSKDRVLTGRVITWVSSNTAVLTVSASGSPATVTAVGVGTATIAATSESISSSPTPSITVDPIPVATVTVSPSAATLVLGITPTQQLTAVTKDANGNVLTGRTVTWISDNTAAAAVDANGLVTAVGAGSATITTTSEGQTGTSAITVTVAPVATVTLSTPTTPMIVGQTQPLTATTKDANGNVLTGRTVTWTSSNTAVLTVSASGSPATVTAVGVGTATITATSESISSSPTPSITVDPIPVATVTVSPSAATLVLGITPTQQLTAVTKDANDNVLTGRVVTWSSSNTGAATVSTSGLVTAVAVGSTTITATSEGKNGTSAITVTVAPVATVTLSAPTTPMIVGGTQQLTATTKDANGVVLTGRVINWVSSNTAVLTVSGSGSPATVTAVGVGTATITATSESVTSSPTPVITVNPVPVATVTVTPGTAALVLGITPTQQLTAVTKDANDNVLTGRVVTWSSSNTGAATVSTSGLVTAVAAGTTTITATSEGENGTSSITVTLAPVETVNVGLAPTSITAVGTSQATATTLDANGNTLSGRTVTWSSGNTAVATVDAQGVVTGIAVGTASITATSEGKSGSATITVTQAPVATVAVSLAASSITAVQTTQASATLRDSQGRTLTGRTITWSSDNTGVATVSSTTGLVTAVSVGTANIIVTSEGITGSAPLTVTQAPVASVTVSAPVTPMIVGGTQQLTATTKDANGAVLTGRTITWVSSNTAVLTVSASGSPATVTAVGVGTATITATSESVSSSPTPTITVNPIPVATVTVSPSTATLVLGITPTQQLTAVTKDANDNVLTGRTVTWISSNTGAATVSTSGLVTAVAAGTTTITATSEGQTGTSAITVTVAPVATVTLSAPTTPMIVGQTQQLTATTKDANGNVLTGRTVTWASSNTAVLTVSASGSPATMTAVGVGTATITATSESISSSPTPGITVDPIPVATVTVTPGTATLVLGITPTQQLTAVTKDANGNVLTDRTVTWSSNNTAAATVDANGLVTAVGAGSATITATSETQTGTSEITVTVAPVATVTLSAPTTPMIVGQTQQLSAVTKDTNGNVLTGRAITWVSSNTAVLTVTASGSPATVTAVGVGTATITATSESISSSPTPSITVDPIPVATVTVSPSAATLVLGITPTQQLTAVTKDANGNVLTGRTVTWASNNTAAATVDANGLVTAVGAGSATITATSETQTGTSVITVTLAPVETVNVGLAPTSITAVGTSQATATTLDANGNTLTGRAITWSSGNTAVATVDAEGVVTGVAVGTSSITATSEGKSGSATITVTPAPVATVTVSTPVTPMTVGGTQQLTATTKDSKDRVLTGRTITWVSSNTAVLTVSASGSSATVTAVGLGTATITATSESVSSSPTPTITVNPAPVATVTVTPASVSLIVGVNPTQQLTAVTKDANGVVLTGRLVTWASSNPSAATVNGTGLVTAVAEGATTITATSEGQTGTSSITVTIPSSFASLLHVSAANRRYFENASGQIVYLTGSHTWSNLQDNGTVDPPNAFNYPAYLDFLVAHNHNFFRLWAWEQSKWTAEIAADYWITPGPFSRTGAGVALDGKPKFDLTQFNEAYFDRLRSRVQAAAARGLYVSIMLFDGWSVGTKGSHTLNNPWNGHPFNSANNVNGIDGDTDGDGNGLETQTLSNSAVTAFQEAYVRRVIDAVADLDNVLFEISNESDPSSKDWQYHMIQVVRSYEATKSKQHPIGMTPMWPDGVDSDLLASAADWISITGDPDAPITANGSKVLISDTDHLCGICGTVGWIWKGFAKGQNPILMDGYDGAAVGLGAEDYDQSDPIWERLRNNMGYARSYAQRMNLATAVPHGDKVLKINNQFVPTGYCLATPGSQYLVFIPGGGNVTLNLSEVSGSLSVEWFNPATGAVTPGGSVSGGPQQTLIAPFGGDAVLFLH